MEGTNRIGLIYGYLVCLAMIIVFLVAASMMINAGFALKSPLKTDGYYGPSASSDLSSVESYKATRLTVDGKVDASLTPAQQTAAYEAAKADRIDTVRFNATKDMTVAVVLLVVAMGLFGWHWRWLKKVREAV